MANFRRSEFEIMNIYISQQRRTEQNEEMKKSMERMAEVEKTIILSFESFKLQTIKISNVNVIQGFKANWHKTLQLGKYSHSPHTEFVNAKSFPTANERIQLLGG